MDKINVTYKPYTFEPDGNDLQKVMFYYGLEVDDPESRIICPFHDDNRPSMQINLDEGIFHCFACQVGGDAFEFVRLVHSEISGRSQLILYFMILNSKKVNKLKLNNVSANVVERKERSEENKEQEQIMALDYYEGLRTDDWGKVDSIYKDYMIDRGFNTSILNYAKAKLTITDDNYPIVFPIYDNGEFKGYVCRTTNKKVERTRKYLYNKGFSRNSTLGGDYTKKVVVVTEGLFDALRLKQYGLDQVVAIFGWKITKNQIDKLRDQGVTTIISALDLDKPGKEGTDYLRNFFDVIEFQYPLYIEGTKELIKDPGDLTEKQFKKAYSKTKKLFRGS